MFRSPPVSVTSLAVSRLLYFCRRQWHTQEFCSTNSVEDRGQGSGDGSPLVRGSGGNCNFVKVTSFHIVKCS